MKLFAKDNNYLDYTFLSHRSTLSNVQNINTTDTKDYVFDLNKTLELNMDLLEKAISTWEVKEEKEKLSESLKMIKENYKKKNKMKQSVATKASKLLIEKQIVEELKRKIEENNEFYKDQIKENEESSDNKLEYIKICEKRLQEIEIHVQKLTKNMTDSPYSKYKDFKMNAFLEKNTALNRQREFLKKDKIQISNMIEEVKKDNQLYQEEIQKDKEDNTNKENDKKIQECVNLYRKKIMMLQSKIKIIRNSFSNISQTLQILKPSIITNDNNKDKHQLNTIIDTIPVKEDDQEKSILPLDMTRKINNFMDFSIILNKKQMDDTKFEDLGKTVLGNGLGNVTNVNMWDFSCINKN